MRRSKIEKIPSGGSVFDPVLPGTVSDGGFEFTLSVDNDEFTFIDPEVAVGYDYEGLDGENFISVLLPEGFGDNIYQLWNLGEATGEFVYTGNELVGGQEYVFEDGGLSVFRVLGIEAGENLDPNDPEAFLRG